VSREIAGRKVKLKELWTFMHKPSFRKIEILGHGYEYIFATSWR
jgi:hypothetical protein